MNDVEVTTHNRSVSEELRNLARENPRAFKELEDRILAFFFRNLRGRNLNAKDAEDLKEQLFERALSRWTAGVNVPLVAVVLRNADKLWKEELHCRYNNTAPSTEDRDPKRDVELTAEDWEFIQCEILKLHDGEMTLQMLKKRCSEDLTIEQIASEFGLERQRVGERLGEAMKAIRRAWFRLNKNEK